MNIQHIENGAKGEFYYEVEGQKLGLMTYNYAGSDKIIIDHTEVDESLKGQGVGYKLVEASVDFARGNNLKIMPLCPFANAVFRKRSEYQDIRF
ncbi:MAG: N-acetyltransferase [Winogradskyella sp.]|uniref:GNAT family N-acetyltransferase n=1 Tax=Winogradskyella sp. TaxID=1883156 RepID=UPI000F3D4E51|nr:GNAT family N-acetyltransferase [Winogradskyella sp.]RNC87249.1 MAG: N-acetyltransferase [Winogradskyella sp.]